MTLTNINEFLRPYLKKNIPDIKPGDTVRVLQKVEVSAASTKKKGDKAAKPKSQVFEGTVIAKKHGKGINATITVRRVTGGLGMEKTFPIHSPNVEKIEITKRAKVRRAKLYYLRDAIGKRARLKYKELTPEQLQALQAKEPVKSEKPQEPTKKEEK